MNLLERPVEVVGLVPRLLKQVLRAVRQDPPWRPRAAAEKSTANSWPHPGQLTAARLCPSALTCRYRAWREARAAANMPSTTPGLMALSAPSEVITRLSRMTVR